MASESASERASCVISAGSPCPLTCLWPLAVLRVLAPSIRTPHTRVRPSTLVQFEIGTKINPLHFLIGRQFRRCAALEDHAVMDDVGVIGNLEGLPHIMVRDQHADTPFLQMKDDLLNVGHGNRV